MAQYVRLPSGRFLELGPDESAQQALMRGMQQHPAEFNLEPEKQPQGGFGAAFSSGLSRLAGETGLTAGKAGIVDLATAEEYYRQQQEKAARIFKPTEKGWTEDPLLKLREVAGGSAAYMLGPLLAGGAAAFAPVSVPVIGAAGLAAGLTSLGQYTGSNIAAQMDEGKKLAETSGALAAATALPQAALDVLSFRMMPGIKAIFGATGKEITEAQAKALAEQTLKQKIGDYAAATGVSMGVEGATEVVQDFLEKAQAGAQLTDPKARADYLESLIGGAALAGVLGPFGRGFERRGIAAEGKRLEQTRLQEEAAQREKERLAALEEERAFKLTPPEGLIGPEAPAELQQQRLQARLAQIEQEVQVARQARDIDKLLQLQRERTALEAQVEEEVSPFDKRRDLEKRISALESLEVKLQERADAATLVGRQPILASLTSVQEQLRTARNELETGEKSGALPKIEKSDAPLLKREQAAIKALLAARETGSGAAQALAAGRLNQIEEQLGLFGMESFAANERSAAEQRRREEEAEAARLAAQKPLLLTDQRGVTPIEMGVNTELFPTVPYKPGPYTQETLFGPPERVMTPSRTEMTLPQIQSTVAQIKERANLSPQDQMMLARLRQKENLTRIERALLTRLEEKTALSPEDQALLERIENVAVPAPGVNIPEALQTRLTALQGVRQRIEQQLLQRGSPLLREEEEVAPAAEPEKEAAPVETPPVNTLPAPNAFRYTVLEKPAYEGVEALSREDAEFELEVLLLEAERGRLTPEWFSRSVIGRMLDTAQMTEVNSNIRQDPVAAVQGLIAAIKPAEAKPAEAKPAEAEAKPAEAEAKPEPKATYKYMRDEYGNLVPILVESKKKAAPVAETAAEAETETEAEAEAEAEVEEEERLSDAAKLRMLRQKVKVSPRVLSLDPSERSEADLTERLQQRLRQNSTLSSLFNRLDRLDQIEKELTEKLRGADRKAGTLLEKLTGRDEQNVTLRQRISDWLSDTAQGRGNEESRRALEEALLLVEQGQRGEKQPLTTLKRRIATQEESKLLGGKKTVSERVETGEAITAQQPELFADTEAASAVEFKTPEEMQAFMASKKLQKERSKQGKQALREAQEAGPPRPDELKRAQQLLRPTIAYLNKQIVGLKNVIKRLTGRVDDYNTMLQVRTEEQEDALIKAKKQLAEVILAISKSLASQHQKYALAKLELDNAQNVYAGLADFKQSVEDAMGQALDRVSAFAGFQTKVKERIEKDLAEKHKAFIAAFEKAFQLRENIVDVDFGEARDKYVSPPDKRQKMTEAVDPYLELWPAYNRALKEAQDAFKAIQDSLEENIGRPLTPSELEVISDEEISNFLEQDATLTEMLIGQRRTVYMYEREVAAAKEALDSARQDQEKDPVWSAFLKEAEAAIQAATDIPKKDLLTEPVALKKAIVAANKQINNLKAQQRDRSIQEQIRQLEEEKDKITMRIKDFSREYLASSLRRLRLVPLTKAEADVLEEKTTPLTEEEKAALEDFRSKRRYASAFTPEEQAALENKTTTLQEIADNRRARIASIDQQINALRKELTTTTLRGERQAKAAQERAEKQAKTQADIRSENERLQRAAAATLQISGLTPEQREAVKKVQKDIESLLEAKAEAIEAKQKQTSNFRLSDELKKDVAAKQKAVRAEAAKKLKAEKDENKKTAIREQAAKDIAKIAADAKELQRAADIQKIEAAFKPQIEKALDKVRLFRDVAPTKTSQREADEEIDAIAETQRLSRTGPVLVDVRTGRVSEPGKDVDDAVANEAKERALMLQFLLGEETTKVLGRQLRPSEFENDTLATLRTKVEKIRKLQQKEVEKAAAQRLTPEQAAEASRVDTLQKASNYKEKIAQIKAKIDAVAKKYKADLATLRQTKFKLPLSVRADIAADKYTEEEAFADTLARKERLLFDMFNSEVGGLQRELAALLNKEALDRIISHDYAARENTPLDQTTAAAVGKGDLKSALESLAENGSTPFVRMVAKQLLPMVENTTLETASLEGKGGEFDPNTNNITLNADALTEEDLLHEAAHAATNAVASYEAKEFGMTRRQFLQGAGAVLTAVKLPDIPANLSLAEQERMFFNMLDAWGNWVKAAKKLAPTLDLDSYTSLDVADRDLRGFLEQMEYNEVSDADVVEMLQDGGLKKLQSAINASQRAIMSEATKQGEGKPTKEKFVPTKEQLAARDALEKLYAKMQERPEFKDEYGNVSFKEFVSELLSNQQVRDKINQTAGLLRRIYEGFLRMLGFNPKTLSDKAVEQAFAMFSPSQASVTPQARLASIAQATGKKLNPVTANLFHGSPNADLTSLQDFSFFTPNQKVAEQYAKKQVAFTGSTTDTGGKVYSVSVSTNNTLDLRIPEHRAAYQEARAKWNKQNPDPEDQLPSLGSEGFVMSTTGLPGYGRIAAVLRAMPEFDSAYVDEGSQGVSLVVKKGSAAQILNRQERLASIARGVFPGTATKYSSAVPKEVQDMVNRTIARTATLGDKITANATGLRMRTFIADSWAPVEALLKMGVAKDKIKEAQALQMRVYMRLFSNQQEYTNAALLNGVPELKTDTDGVRNIEGGDARANAKTIAAALSKASKLGNQQAVERLFTMWMASLRAKQDGVGFDKLNFKNPPTAAELTALEQMFKDNPDVKDAFEEARRLYKEHNKRLLNLQVQTGAMSKEVADELGKGDYVGYYRVNDNGVVELMMGGSRPMRIGSVVDQPYLKELVGGEQHILPFFSSMVQNTSMLMTIALRNVQNDATANMFKKMELGEIIKVKEGSKAPVGKIHFKRDGDEYWFDADADAFEAAGIPADLMMQGLQGVKTTIPGLVRALAVPANFLRKAVRRLPTYTLRQTIRDPMHAWMVTGGNFTPVLSTWKELYKGMTNTSQTQMTLKEAAVVGNNVYSGDTEGVADMLRQLSGNQSQFAKRMMQLDEFAMKGEAATRAVLYDTFRQKGMGHVEALLNTAETMNFGRRGTSASLQWLSMLTPFFNAQIQGLDSVYRSLKGDNTFEQKMNARNMLLKRGALLAASTMMYALMMEDDEAYKNATPAERYGNWFVPVPGTDKTIRVPIPFELGLIFKSMPEAFVNTAFGDTKAKEAIKALAKQAYMSSPVGHSQSIPTAVKGPLELAFNYNMFSDQPVETARERAMDADERYRESTTEVAKLLGKFGVLSPVQIDHLVRSYTSSAGIALLSMANFALRPLTTREGVEKPDWVLEEVPVIGPLFQPKTGRGMVNAAFEDMMRIERAAQTYKTLAGSDPEAARAYADDYAKQISLAPLGGQFRQQMGEFAKYKRMVAMNPNLTAAEKREQIEKIKQQEIQYSTMLRKVAA